MKIFINDIEILQVSDLTKKVIADLFPENLIEQEIIKRIKNCIDQLYQESFSQMKRQWEKRINERHELVPTNPEKYAELILGQSDYKSKSKINEEIEINQRIIREEKERALQQRILLEKVRTDSQFIIQ